MGWPEPRDREVVGRMRGAFTRACRALIATPIPGHNVTWGCRGRTISGPVTTAQGLRWLRVAASEHNSVVEVFWAGTVAAHTSLPSSIPRPRMDRWCEWSDGEWLYRGELYEYVPTRAASPHPVLTSPISMPEEWWRDLRAALHTLATIPTTRTTTHPGFHQWAMPHYLGVSPAEFRDIPWETAHGDLRFANLAAPRLCIFDWEGWGRAPREYDAATLRTTSLLVPDVVQQIDHHFSDVLHTPAGRYAELVVITEFLHLTAEYGTYEALVEPMRRRAAQLLDNPFSAALQQV